MQQGPNAPFVYNPGLPAIAPGTNPFTLANPIRTDFPAELKRMNPNGNYIILSPAALRIWRKNPSRTQPFRGITYEYDIRLSAYIRQALGPRTTITFQYVQVGFSAAYANAGRLTTYTVPTDPRRVLIAGYKTYLKYCRTAYADYTFNGPIRVRYVYNGVENETWGFRGPLHAFRYIVGTAGLKMYIQIKRESIRSRFHSASRAVRRNENRRMGPFNQVRNRRKRPQPYARDLRLEQYRLRCPWFPICNGYGRNHRNMTGTRHFYYCADCVIDIGRKWLYDYRVPGNPLNHPDDGSVQWHLIHHHQSSWNASQEHKYIRNFGITGGPIRCRIEH